MKHDDVEVKIVAGIHKGKRGILTGMFWGAGVAAVSVCGEEVYVEIERLVKCRVTDISLGKE